MTRKITLVLAFLGILAGIYAQTAPENPNVAVETMYLRPKRGMEDKFEAAVKAHIAKFHPAGPYAARLRYVEYGEKAGWYVWSFGPTAFSTLDNPLPKESGHEQDWNANIDPLVEEYGITDLWTVNYDLTYGFDIMSKSKYMEIWQVDLKRGDYYRFKAMAEKLKKVYESLGTTAFIVLDNMIHRPGGPDIGLAWSFNTFKGWYEDPGPKDTYEKMYGAGSWNAFMDEWKDILVDYTAEIRTTKAP